jgi:DNA-binding XRE family transcriptional regulator
MTIMARMHRKIEHTSEDKARLQTIRDHFQTTRPSLDDLVASGEYSEPVQHGVTLDAMHIASLLKHAREEAHLSLADVAARCGLDRAAISRLENGLYENTTINTLHRLAGAYGKRFLVQLVDAC